MRWLDSLAVRIALIRFHSYARRTMPVGVLSEASVHRPCSSTPVADAMACLHEAPVFEAFFPTAHKS